MILVAKPIETVQVLYRPPLTPWSNAVRVGVYHGFFNFLTSRIFQAWQVRHKYDKKEKDHELGPFLLDGGAQGFHVGMVINFGQHTQVTMSKKFGDHQP